MPLKYSRSTGSFRYRTPSVARTRRWIDACSQVLVVLALAGTLVWPRPEPYRAYMHPVEVLPESADLCTRVVGGGKVALLFLTHGAMHHDQMWKLWFHSAAGVVPADVAAGAACSFNESSLALAREACLPHKQSGRRRDVIARQHLFSVYVHLSAEIHDGVLGRLWRGHQVKHRVETEWGTHSLVEAERNLLWEAFRDPANQRFVLISESDVPIWDPLTFYQVLMTEERSRVDAWWHPDMHEQRWTWRMALSAAQIHRSSWRKSAQWFSIVRSHAEIALRDEVVFEAFEEYCTAGWDGDYHRRRECYSDEHYLPTLLHLAGVQEETVPSPLGVAAADWSENRSHPREFPPVEITPALFAEFLRSTQDCPTTPQQQAAAQEAASGLFVRTADVLGPSRATLCSRLQQIEPPNGTLLPSTCYLTARKFGAEGADTVVSVFRNCSNGLAMVSSSMCGRGGQASIEEGDDAETVEHRFGVLESALNVFAL